MAADDALTDKHWFEALFLIAVGGYAAANPL